MSPSDAELTACCSAAYSSDVAELLLGASYHPGGLSLTRRLAGVLRIGPGDRVLDVACGRGSSALLVARETGARVDGLDHSAGNTASAAATAAGLDRPAPVTFRTGDAVRLPYPDAAVDVVYSECALCTFPDPERATTELARVLRPGGRAGITDVTVEGPLPAELVTPAARIACVADARSLDGYRELLTGAGLRVTTTERHDAAIGTMIDQIEARLQVLRMTAAGRLATSGVDPDAASRGLAAARRAVAAGVLGYALLVAEKPAAGADVPTRR